MVEVILKMREIFDCHFAIIEDPRCQCNVIHKLSDVLIIVMLAVLCNFTDLEAIVDFGNERIDFLKKHFNITKVPSISTLSRILEMVNAELVSLCVVEIMKELYCSDGEVVAIDGKTIRSTEKMENYAKSLQIMTAYLTESGISLGQLAIDEKTNEIPCMKDLIDLINVKGKVITADAMHCQKETVKKIIDKKCDYVLQVKGNQGTLSDDIKLMFTDLINSDFSEDKQKYTKFETIEKGHGRIEKRVCRVLKDISWLENAADWIGLRSVFSVERTVNEKGKESCETSYYISSLEPNPEKLLKISREHWKVESLHWILDVVMNEDNRQIRSENGQKTLNIFSKTAISIHKNFIAGLSKKVSVRRNMHKCLLNPSYLEEILASL